MKRNTKLDNERSKVYGTKRIYTTGAAIERAESIGDADAALQAAQEAATNAVATAVEKAQDAQEARKAAEIQAEQEKQKEADAAALEVKKKKAQAKAATAVQAAVNEVVGGTSVVEAETVVADAPTEQGEDKDKPEPSEQLNVPAKKKAVKKG